MVPIVVFHPVFTGWSTRFASLYHPLDNHPLRVIELNKKLSALPGRFLLFGYNIGMENKQLAFLPFHAINQFMLEDYRQEIIRYVLMNFEQLPTNRRKAILGLIRKHVTVPGFRDASQAPLAVKVKGVEKAFEKKAEMTAQVLMGWSELKPDLALQVFDFLTRREWQVMPVETDRTRLPGFLPEWPTGEDYDILEAAFIGQFPQAEMVSYDFRLMVVWLSGRLPFNTN